MTTTAITSTAPVLLFDGVCNLCNAAVNWVIDHDEAGRVRLGALQSDAGQALLAQVGLTGDYLDSLVLIEGGQAYVRSDAALRLAAHLNAPWSYARALLAIPRPVRDAVYDVIAKNRYAWFGKRESCRVPTPALRARFI
jgi:predicted DCC family thiol-disulfide oxidoreductase YuxK